MYFLESEINNERNEDNKVIGEMEKIKLVSKANQEKENLEKQDDEKEEEYKDDDEEDEEQGMIKDEEKEKDERMNKSAMHNKYAPILVIRYIDGSIHIWNASSTERIRMINVHHKDILSLIVGVGDGQCCALTDKDDKTARLFTLEGHDEPQKIKKDDNDNSDDEENEQNDLEKKNM
ncbi:MAG: hypothetical protein EZS28_034090 [Streblomastix strix]|uniref:Uncharacterized protein n=1 Tax=Streblomastix strix TaxID=222440 RepID=A0A5J4UJH8_9EUKA|nr:MAG: hypothetical protein EZS28_034090 [Streblomastix strix]